jgi:hypothetical protein
LSNFFQASQTAQGGRLTTAGWATENEEFFILDCKIKILHSDNITILFPNMIVRNACHNFPPI